ncbi:MAG: tRNA uridine-5-carboxymethylaminomethyl(34) synthesis GTPase MnmE [Armatimonadetes bacterium]|nr:tRNA uridine-5-carboxymethylaminomethyl(34) synthesis GTPase MnmE [Armatimonadota bacterium]
MGLARHSDTIVAPITAAGGAVAVVRVSGPSAWAVAKGVFLAWPDPVEARRAVYGTFCTGDDGLALPFAEGASYTGELSVELSVHGSPASINALVEACITGGARMAEPGEFTLRAFMNGRIDLTQAEGVRDTVNAQTGAQLRQANLLRDGLLRETVSEIRDAVVSVLVAVEASTDFSEEIGELDRDKARRNCSAAIARIVQLLASADDARMTRHGASIAIAGLPNAGKSSLLNAVLKSDRAIVAESPGTTRDTVEESVSIGGVLCTLIDTAGLRDSDDDVERQGIERSRFAVSNADQVWYVYDSSVGWTEEDDRQLAQIEAEKVVVANKIDLGGDPARGLPVSAKTGSGLPGLLEKAGGLVANGDRPALVNQRHTPLLQGASDALSRVVQTLDDGQPDDLAAVDLQSAARSLGEITGETAAPDVIDRVFHDFCIGK